MNKPMSYIIVFLATSSFWSIAWVVHQALFASYRKQVAAECGAPENCRFQVVPGEARPQQIYEGVVRVGEAWLVSRAVPAKSISKR